MTMTAMDLVADAKQNITKIDLETAKQAIATDLILDVREPAEYSAGCLPGAINIPRGVLEFKISSHPDFQYKQDSRIVVYCQSHVSVFINQSVDVKIAQPNCTGCDNKKCSGYKPWAKVAIAQKKYSRKYAKTNYINE